MTYGKPLGMTFDTQVTPQRTSPRGGDGGMPTGVQSCVIEENLHPGTCSPLTTPLNLVRESDRVFCTGVPE